MSRSRPCPSARQPTPLPGPDNTPQPERPSKANGPTVSQERHKGAPKEKRGRKGGSAGPPARGHSHSVPLNTCSCTAWLITAQTGTHKAAGVGTWGTDYWFGTVLIWVCCWFRKHFTLLLGFCPLTNCPPYLQRTPRRNACWLELLLCPASLSNCGQMTTQNNKAWLRWLWNKSIGETDMED